MARCKTHLANSIHRTTTIRYAGEMEEVLLMGRKIKPPMIE